MRRTILGLALAAGIAAVPAAATAMPLYQLVERGTALEKKGAMALFHQGEIKALQDELSAASKQVLNERLAAEKAGRKAAYCPPKVRTKADQVSSQQLLKELRAISATQPKTATVADEMRIYLAKRYPCS